jgi:UDP-N-acetylmuramyl tripeptide synthase
MPKVTCTPYFGPSRRSDTTVVDITIKFHPDDREVYPRASDVKALLVDAEILVEHEIFPRNALPEERMARYSSLLLQTALLLQRKVGHDVKWFSSACIPEQYRCAALLEYEHCDMGMTAIKLAAEVVSGQRKLIAEPFRLFCEFAGKRLLPVDTNAIIKAAGHLEIPCIHLERWPFTRESFQDLTLGDCIRENGLIMLGHGIHQHVLDGTFCLDKSGDLKNLLFDSTQRQKMLEKLAVPLTKDSESQSTVGDKYLLIAANGQIIAVINQLDGKNQPIDKCHISLINQALTINHEVGLAPVGIMILTTDITRPFEQTKGGFLDFALAPDLSQYLGRHVENAEDLLNAAAIAIIDWLFPTGSKAGIPIVAITGTNGKTTTTRMVNHIFEQAAQNPGMVCTDGAFVGDQQLFEGDQCTIMGHLKMLTNKTVDAAVLETHHHGILRRGFAFQRCDIAVCLNVSDDHLGVDYIETIEQMAEVKCALIKRARKAAVLNADDPNCLAMLESVSAETTCLVSMNSPVNELRTLIPNKKSCYCVLELVDGQQWIVIHDQAGRLPVIDVGSIPATFDGTARFNVSNAMHAVASSYLVGTDVGDIRTAMGCFNSGYDSTPGRLNVFDELSFRIISDFAHNPDGFRKMSEFVDQQSVSGRKLVAFAGSGDRSDETLKDMSSALAGHFDFYFCKEHVPQSKDGKARFRHVAHIMQQGLVEAGVMASQTTTLVHGKDVIFEIFDTCKKGDLLVMLLGHVEKHQMPGYIREYAGKSV